MYTKQKWVVVPTGIVEYPYCIDTEDKEVAKIHGLQNNGEAKANANLIASAPDLYEACKMALQTLEVADNLYHTPRTQTALKQALAKAEGK